MRNLFLAKDTRQLLRDKRTNQPNCAFINLDTFIAPDDGFDKASFEKRYLDLIASLGKEMKSMYWWASALPEKNSFTSKLFGRLYRLTYLDRAIKEISEKDIAVVTSDPALIRQIRLNHRKDFAISLPFSTRISIYFEGLASRIKGALKQSYTALDEYGRVLYARRVLRDKKSAVEKKGNYIVLRTWVDHRNYKSGKYKDSYFKNLPHFLSARNENILTFAGIISDYKNIIARFKEDTGNLIIPANFYIKGIDILRCLFCAYFRRPSIKRHVFLDNQDITYIISAELLQDISKTTFFASLIQYYSCMRLAGTVSVKRFIYTFENYAWEKMSILGLRRQDPAIKIIGFQHAFTSRNSFKYFPGRGEDRILPLPDRIVTMGRRTQEIMKHLGNYPDGIFSTGCALRQEYLFKMTALARNTGNGIFVPLTITVEDTIKVLRFLFESGLGKRQEKVYFRFHPATPIKAVLDKLGFQLPGNFIISDNPPMRTEMERCSIVLYTWTTICLEALKMGRPAIYLDVNYPLEVDPLFECNYFKDICRKPAELIGKIERLRGAGDEAFRGELKRAQEYLDEYFMPVNEHNLNVFIA